MGKTHKNLRREKTGVMLQTGFHCAVMKPHTEDWGLTFQMSSENILLISTDIKDKKETMDTA